MVSEFGILSVLPPLLAIILALKTRQVYISLVVGIWLGKQTQAFWFVGIAPRSGGELTMSW